MCVCIYIYIYIYIYIFEAGVVAGHQAVRALRHVLLALQIMWDFFVRIVVSLTTNIAERWFCIIIMIKIVICSEHNDVQYEY